MGDSGPCHYPTAAVREPTFWPCHWCHLSGHCCFHRSLFVWPYWGRVQPAAGSMRAYLLDFCGLKVVSDPSLERLWRLSHGVLRWANFPQSECLPLWQLCNLHGAIWSDLASDYLHHAATGRQLYAGANRQRLVFAVAFLLGGFVLLAHFIELPSEGRSCRFDGYFYSDWFRSWYLQRRNLCNKLCYLFVRLCCIWRYRVGPVRCRSPRLSRTVFAWLASKSPDMSVMSQPLECCSFSRRSDGTSACFMTARRSREAKLSTRETERCARVELEMNMAKVPLIFRCHQTLITISRQGCHYTKLATPGVESTTHT